MALEQTRFTLLGLNPNDVATFIAILILSLPVLLKWTMRWSWFVWPVEVILVGLLIGTGSRGGLLALICGTIVSVIVSSRTGSLPKNWRIWAGVGLVVLLGVGIGLAVFPKGLRIGTVDVSPGASAERRLEVWATVPNMLASAPNGWGQGNSAEAYEQWFEPIGVNVELKHLLSSHLTWLVEFGWPLRWVYLFLWMVAILLLTPSQNFKFSIWGVAVWTAFFVALFYNAAGKWWNWPVPLLWLLTVVILRCRQRTFPAQPYWVLSAFFSGCLVGLPFVIIYLHPSEIPISGWNTGGTVVVGEGKSTVAILGPSKQVLGNFYGQEIRKQCAKGKSSVIILDHSENEDRSYLANCGLYVVSGADADSLKIWESMVTPRTNARLVLINCRAEPDDWMKAFGRVVYCRGEYFGDPFYNEWRQLSTTNPSVAVTNIPGSETYIADWWPLLGEETSK